MPTDAIEPLPGRLKWSEQHSEGGLGGKNYLCFGSNEHWQYRTTPDNKMQHSPRHTQ